MEKPAMDKHSSLLRKCVNYGRNFFYKIGHRAGLLGFVGTTALNKTTLNKMTFSITVKTVKNGLLSVKL
jgi:hypothetical protein